ncbi:hypothetical protein FJZ26_06235, partial [Candidatus Parvarchaeota archaeon]|nr:hypothetical protein [Candidatus Parvarchaeota archaeon]
MIEFTDFTEHFKTPPSLYRLLGHVKDLRKGKAKVLVIVPCYGDSMRLEAFFKSMKRQEFKDFDILAVYGQHDRFVDSKGLSVIHARRKVDFGFAGAVYLGQLMAQKLGYKYFLATDVDRHPYSPKSLGILFESAIKTGAQCVFGGHLTKGAYSASEDKFIEQKNGRAAKGQTQPMSYMSSVWWLISTSYLSKTGLYLLPIYLGSDDSEFEYRLRRAGGKIVQLSVPITYGYCALKGQKYASLLQNGGLDTTYFYADIFSNTNFPHVFLPARGSLAYYMLVRAYHFLVLNMLQLRIPKLAA